MTNLHFKDFKENLTFDFMKKSNTIEIAGSCAQLFVLPEENQEKIKDFLTSSFNTDPQKKLLINFDKTVRVDTKIFRLLTETIISFQEKKNGREVIIQGTKIIKPFTDMLKKVLEEAGYTININE